MKRSCENILTIALINIHYLYNILSLSSRMTMTSVRIPEKDAYYRACNLCVFSQKECPD